jgi:DNA-binding PucR family transcriptional regulator
MISQLLLRRLAGNGSAMRLLEDTRFQRLRDYDRDNGSAYIPTLATYLDALGDAVSTAATCGVHANTVRHRMRRVEELLDVDLSDPDDRLVLWLQLRLHSAASLSDGPPGVASPAIVQRP